MRNRATGTHTGTHMGCWCHRQQLSLLCHNASREQCRFEEVRTREGWVSFLPPCWHLPSCTGAHIPGMLHLLLQAPPLFRQRGSLVSWLAGTPCKLQSGCIPTSFPRGWSDQVFQNCTHCLFPPSIWAFHIDRGELTTWSTMRCLPQKNCRAVGESSSLGTPTWTAQHLNCCIKSAPAVS